VQKFREPRNQGDIGTDPQAANVARVAFQGVQLVRNKKDQQTSRLQYAKTLRQHSRIALRVFEDFDHGDGIETVRSKGQLFASSLYAWNGLLKRLQMRHMKINSANELRSPRKFFCIAAVSAT
jgi:hypothetical protein